MTCNYWKVFSEWHGFKAWLGFVPFSKLGLVKYQTLARRRPRWRTISSDCTWPALVKMETETVSLKTKRISCLRYLRWEWSKPGRGLRSGFKVGVSSLVFPLPHSHPKTCSHDSDIQTFRQNGLQNKNEQEWKFYYFEFVSQPPPPPDPPLKIFWKDRNVLTNSLKCRCI